MFCDPVIVPYAAGCLGLHRKKSIQTDILVQAFRPKTSIKPSADDKISFFTFHFIREKKHKTSSYPSEASTFFQIVLENRGKID